MKLWLYALGMCQSMFCALPFPWHGWEERARDRMLLCLPVIGLEIGVIWWGASLLCRWLPDMLAGFLLCALPYLLTGFIHLDGFVDVTDAVRSWRSLERRREILKDSHVGSFAVIGAVLLILCQFCACVGLRRNLEALILIPAVSRCCSVAAIFLLPPMQTSQYSGRRSAPWLPVSMLAVLLAAGFVCSAMTGMVLLAVVAGYALALWRSVSSLKGMNGDISGYCICLGELAGLLALGILP